jgi:hypothetical protein
VLFHGQDLDVALASVDADAYVNTATLEQQIDRPLPDAEVLDPNLLQKRRGALSSFMVELSSRGRSLPSPSIWRERNLAPSWYRPCSPSPSGCMSP